MHPVDTEVEDEQEQGREEGEHDNQEVKPARDHVHAALDFVAGDREASQTMEYQSGHVRETAHKI